MEPSFDVLKDPWIPVEDLNGETHELSILDALSRAHELRSVCDVSPLVEYSVYRFLVVFLMDALRPQRLSDIEDMLDGGSFDWKASGKYPWLAEPNPSYHGVSFAEAAPGSAFATYIRAVLLRDTGATLSPFHAFLLLQGLETLSLRVERHVENALKVVEYLAAHPQVEAVHHPSLDREPTHALYKKYLPNGGGSVFTFEIRGDEEDARKFIDSLPIFSLLANVADVKSLVIHPATTTHSQCTQEELAEQGIRPNTIRLSIGIERAEDLIAALETAFQAVRNGER